MSDYLKDLFEQTLRDSQFKDRQEQQVSALGALEERFEIFSNTIYKYVKHGGVEDVLRTGNKDDKENEKTDQTNKKKEPLSAEENILVVKVKKEKLSTDFSACSSTSISEIKENLDIKKENMPAPSWIPPKKKGKQEKSAVRSSRTKGKKATSEAQRDSDIIIQNEHIDTICLTDDAEEEQPVTRSTRTRTKKLQEQAASQSGSDLEGESRRNTKNVKNKKEENAELTEKRSTRTRTIKKDTPKEPEEPQPEVRSTRTRTLKKTQKEEEEAPQETRSTRTRTLKKAVAESQTSRDSNDASNLLKADTTQIIQGKDKDDAKVSKKNKRVRSDSTDEENTQDKKDSKKSKSSSPKVNDVTTKTVYEDAVDTQQPQLDSTYVTASSREPQTAALNATVTIAPKENPLPNSTAGSTKPNFNIFDSNVNALLTDDDSLEVKSPQKAPAKKTKEVFSPYEKTTLKKKVEAFEKLHNATNTSNSGISLWKGTRGTPNIVKEKSKMYTPLGSKFIPGSSSTTKISRLLGNHQLSTTNNDSLLAMKTAQKESREKQRKQMEREQALKKKEVYLQAQAEAKRKLNEEKQLKAQQQRKILEAEKQKQLEVQKQKEERYRQRELEKEEYLKAQKLELEKKRLEHKKRAKELQARQQREEQEKKLPVYMTTRMPKLPTFDCYDSDDPDYKKVDDPPSWSVGEQLRTRLFTMLAAGDRIKNTLFCRHAQTPDLIEIFEDIDKEKLKRSSSVMWKAPPRYTMMPNLNDTRFSEDDELYDSD